MTRVNMSAFYRACFRTEGEATAAERGWSDAARGWVCIESSAAYRKGYWDRVEYDDMRAESRTDHDDMED